MSKRDKLRLEITHTAGPLTFADLFLGDSKAASIHFHTGDTARRVLRRLGKFGVEIKIPGYVSKSGLQKR